QPARPPLAFHGHPEPIPVRGGGRPLFTVEELEACLEDPLAARKAWAGGAFTRQHDAEDGSDLFDWPVLQESADPQERVLHAVLQWGDLRDPHQWQPLLRQAAARLGLPPEEAGALEESLAHFLYDSGHVRFWEAERCWRRHEFLLEWPRKKPPCGLQQKPVVRGV